MRIERLAFAVACGAHQGLAQVHDVPFRRRNPGAFRMYSEPAWPTRWQHRLQRRES